MIDNYKKAMDRIKTDAQYKSNFIADLENVPPVKKHIRILPVFSYLSTAAAMLLVVYCTALFFMKQPDDATLKIAPEQERGISVANNVRSGGTNVFYFTFDGFERYDVEVESKAILLNDFEEGYTVANLLNDYYQLIVGENGDVAISNGMVDRFLNVNADSEKEINVYVNDRELLNLENELVSDCIESQDDVYFKVSVVE